MKREEEFYWKEHALPEVRFVYRNGEKVLQQKIRFKKYSKWTEMLYNEYDEWTDVPVVNEWNE